ncbi:MAG: hypothetical protein WC059_01855 [Candidatus Paceibacterota bacterium]
MKKIISFSAIGFTVAPLFAFAANIFDVLRIINQILSTLIPILITLAVVYFIWGVIQYTISTDEEAKKGARNKIIQGLIGLFLIVSFWGIIKIVSSTFGADRTVQLQINAIPCIPGPGVYC